MSKQTAALLADYWAEKADIFRKERDALLAECAAMRLHIDRRLDALEQQMAQREQRERMFAAGLLERLRGLTD